MRGDCWRHLDASGVHHSLVIDPANLNDDDNWTGGSYELAIELGPRDDGRLERALLSAWRHASAAGCVALEYKRNHMSSRVAGHVAVPLSLDSLNEHGHLCGVVQIPSGARVVCGVVAVREDDGPDWLDFYLPLGALCGTDARIGGFPFGDDYGMATHEWRQPIDAWLADIGSRVYSDVPFRLALIGHEVSGDWYADQLSEGDPERRDIGYLIPHASGVRYIAADR